MSTALTACRTCKVEKPETEFYRNSKNKSGREGSCKDCIKNHVRTHREKNIDYVNWYDRQRGLLPHRRAANKKYLESHVTQRRATNRAWSKRHSAKKSAMAAVANALQQGIIKSSPCAKCGSKKSEAHHEDYTKPLDVAWLCRPHHRARHVEILNNQRINNNPAVANFARRRKMKTNEPRNS